jgi:predicted ATPase
MNNTDDVYDLIDTETQTIVTEGVELSAGTAEQLNYAYAINGSTLRYFCVDEPETKLFKYNQPV